MLRSIREHKPASLTELAALTCRVPSDLSRTLKTMERYDLVEMRREVRTVCSVVKVSEFVILAA